MSERSTFERLRRKVKRLVLRPILTRAIPRKTKRLIVFLSPGHEFRAGGVMAIASMYRESLALRHLHDAQVVMCNVPGDPTLLQYDWFRNRNYMLDLEAVLKRCQSLDYLLLHIPEYTVNQVLDWLNLVSPELMSGVRELHLNVLLQNIDMVQGQNVAALGRFGKVTCTTGHQAYSNRATREALGVPTHKLGAFIGPELYSRSGYQDKEPLLIVSSDGHPLKDQVLRQIAHILPELKIQVIRDLSYEDYAKLIRRTKWSLTFGEGLDSYFVEPIFCGAVSFAVYNERFFTPAFAKLETVYPSWEILISRIAADLRRLDEPIAYNRCWQEAYNLLSDLHGTERFRENLRMFYRGEYTFP